MVLLFDTEADANRYGSIASLMYAKYTFGASYELK